MKTNKNYSKIIILGAQNSGKTTLSNAIMLKVLANGGEIDLGCDPCMTQEGRAMVEKVNELKRKLKNV